MENSTSTDIDFVVDYSVPEMGYVPTDLVPEEQKTVDKLQGFRGDETYRQAIAEYEE
jgi:hypothetical protein